MSITKSITNSFENETIPLGRRAFLSGGALLMTAAATLNVSDLMAQENQPKIKAALITDLHYADKAPAGSRHYRQTPGKLAEAAARFEQEKINFVVELGDLIDAAESVDVEKKYLATINREFAKISEDRHYVLGNHCVDTLTKEEFLGGVDRERSYYSFDRGGVHFVVLDACFRSDGKPYGRKSSKWTDANIVPEELEWLQADLKEAARPTIVFAHQRLDVSTAHGVKNGEQVRRILESSGQVAAVFQGHSHDNDYKEINGIHYCTLVAMVEGSGVEQNGYSILEITPGGPIQLSGFRKQSPRRWNA